MSKFDELMKQRQEGIKTDFDKLLYQRNQNKLATELKNTDISDIYSSLSKGGYIDNNTLSKYKARLSDYMSKYNQLDSEDTENKSSYMNTLKNLESNLKSYSKYMSQWKTEDDYNKAIEGQKNREKMLSFDLNAGKSEVDNLYNINKELKDIERKRNQIVSATAVPNNSQLYELDKREKELLKQSGYKSANDVNTAYSKKSTFYNQARILQNSENLKNNALKSPDFEEYSKKGADIVNPSQEEANGLVKIGKWGIGSKDVGNIVTYSRDNWEDIIASQHEGTNVVGNYKYHYMTDDEVNIYNYYLSKENEGQLSKGTAKKFLDSIEDTLNQREAGIIYDGMKDKTALELAFGISAGTEQFASGIQNLFNTKEDYIAPSPVQYASGMVREDLADKGPKILGNSLGQIGYDTITTVSNMLPTIAASYISNAIVPGSGEIVGNALLGASAAGNEYAQMLNSGMNKSQARAISLIQGAWEGASEYYLGAVEGLGTNKLGQFVKSSLFEKSLGDAANGTVKAVLKFFADKGIDAFNEGMEEVIQDIGSSIINGIATGEWKFSNIEEYAYNFVLGSLTAVGMNGASDIIRGVSRGANNLSENNKYGKMFNGEVDLQKSLVGEGLESADGTLSKKLAEKYQGRLDKGKELSGNQIRKLVNANEEAFILEDIKNIKSNVSEYLSQLGEKGNIDVLSSAIANKIAGNQLSTAEETAISKSKYAERVLNELNTDNIASGQYSTSISEKLNTSRINPNVYGLAEKVSKDNALQKEGNTVNTDDSPHEIANTNGTTSIETVVDRETINETLTDNSAEETSPEALKRAIQSVDNKNLSKADLDFIQSEYDGTIPASDYVRGMLEGYNFGYSMVPESAIRNEGYFAYLTDLNKKHAYSLGYEAAKAKAETQSIEIKKGFNGKKGHKSGVVKGEDVSLQELKKAFNDTQNKAYKILSTIAGATGINIVLYKSKANANGKFTGDQGKFKYSDNTIYIDINAGLSDIKDINDLGKYAMLRTFNHEFVHFLEKWSPKEYNAFRKLIFEELENRGESVNDLIETKMSQTKGLSYDKASREVVAEAMTDILPDSKFIENLAKSNPNIFQKLLDKLKEFFNDIKSYFESIGYNRSREANALKVEIEGQLHYLKSIIDKFDKVAETAINNYQHTFGVDEDVKETSVSAEKKKETIEPTTAKNDSIVADYFNVKKNYKDSLLFYRVGDFYEAMGNDAKSIADVLDLTLTSRTFSNVRISMCGIPVRFIDTYKNRLIESGYKVEVYDKDLDNETSKKGIKFAKKSEWTSHDVEWTVPNYKKPIAFSTVAASDLIEKMSKDNFNATISEIYDMITYDVEAKRVLEAYINGGFGKQIASEWFARSNNKNIAEVTNDVAGNLETSKSQESGKTVRQNNNGTVSAPESDGKGTSRLLDEGKAEDVQGVSGQRKSSKSSSERGRQTERNGDRIDTTDRLSRGEGNGEIGDIRGDDGLTEEEKQVKTEELHETVKEQIEQKSTETPKGNNFVIEESLNLPDGEKSRFRANIDAIKLVKQLESEGRYATLAEQEVLSKYVGWGGLANAFGEMTYNRETRKSEMVAKKGWENEFAEFRKLVDDGIITEDEYSAASGSTKNAHYTSIEVIKAMYGGLSQLGFNGGRMLEPSSGIGNFVGAMPSAMSSKVNSWTMVELDSITGLIAKYLYPNADVRIEGFEKANIPNDYMDVAIGNVPFGNYGVVDRTYPKRVTKAIHNYFFAKTLDKVRIGGIVMFITSSFTMNSQNNEIRQYIMDRADLIGAIRLPNNAFSDNAGTQVVTDILVLKKRAMGTEYAGESFLESPQQRINNDSWQTANINEYFTNHPEMVLGTPEFVRGMYGPDSLTYKPLEGKGTLGQQITEAFKNIDVKIDYPAKLSPEKINFNSAREGKKSKKNGFARIDGKIYKRVGVDLEEVTDNATSKRIEGLLTIRDAYRTLVNYLQQGQAENLIKQARKDLNVAYDEFVKENGYINSQKNKSAIADDPDSYSIYALENYDVKTKKAIKADIFTKDTIKPNVTVTHVDDISSGVIVSINTTGGVDASLIAKLTGKSESDITRELIAGRLAFKRKDGSLEAPETYLSGNVRAKLKEAEALAPIDKDFKNNVEELKKVIPKDIPFNDIYVTPGSPWIPNEVYADFIAETLGGYNNSNSYSGPDVTVSKNVSGEFSISINNSRLKFRYQNTQEFGTSRKSFIDIMKALMASTSTTVYDYIEDGDGRKKAVLNKPETDAVQEKVDKIKKQFEEWLWKDENRRTELASLYNETYNALVNPKYNGSNLTVNGINAEFTLREHQANAVQRIISSGGNTLLAHRVGAGKTLEMAAAAMKLRELGIVKKPMFVVPKSLVAQWGVEFKNYFPAAKLLVADEKSFTKANRKVFTNTIANGDFDAVIVSYEQFEKVPMSEDFTKEFYQEQIDEIIAAIAEEKAESNGKSLSVKEMEKKKAQLEKKIAELTTKVKDEDNIDFETLGIDSLFVDEAHNFKNLQYTTRMTNVSGLGNSNGSQRAFDLYTKIRYLQRLNGGRGIVFATATPVMNSMSEMYIMQKYLQSDMLNQLGIKSFDAWAKQFGEVKDDYEVKPSGIGFRKKTMFKQFRNLNELQLLFRSFSDVLTQVPGLKIPKMKGGEVKTVVCEAGEFQKEYMKQLEERAKNVKNVDASVDNMLKISSDGRKVSYTQRMIDPSLPYEPNCKIYKCCENVLEEYRNSKSIKGTQIIFCDMSTPKGTNKLANNTEAVDDSETDTESVRLYDDMKSYLVKKGIPSNEIAFIHEADTDAKKKQLFADVNEGKVRVLIGSTGKMGVGMNAQKRIVAIHHIDAPWRPGDIEQRDGRAFRQKNINDEVSKYVYVTEGTYDTVMWDKLKNKQYFIEQIMNGEDVGRTAEDTGEVKLSAAEVMASASGDGRMLELMKLSDDVKKLEGLQKVYKSSLTAAKAKLLGDTQKIATVTNNIENGKLDIKSRVDTYSDGKFLMTVDGKNYNDKKEAGISLLTAITSKAVEGELVSVGKFAGFELRVIKQKAEYFGSLVGNNSYNFNVYMTNTTQMVNRICELVKDIEGKITFWENQLSELKTDYSAQEKIIAEPFAYEEELNQKRGRYNELWTELNPPEEQHMSEDEQAQSRKYLEDDDKKGYNKKNYYNETETLFRIWENSSAPVGEVKKFFRFGKHHFYEKTEIGCVELSLEQYENKKGMSLNENYIRANNQVNEIANNDGASKTGNNGNIGSNGNSGRTPFVSKQTIGEELRSDTGGSLSVVRGSGNGTDVNDEQHQSRTDTLTDREILEIATNEISTDDFTAGEKAALDIFQNRLANLQDLQKERIEQGRLYKEQQFGANPNKKSATETINRMRVLDSQIKTASAELLSVEEKEVLKRVLQKSRNVIEKIEREKGAETLKRWRDRRNEAGVIKKYRERINIDVDELTKWVLKPDNKNVIKHIPDTLKNTVIPFLTSIDFTSKRQLNGGSATKADSEFVKKLNSLKGAIKSSIDINGMYSGYNDLPADFMDNLQRFIDATQNLVDNNSGEFVINQMTGAELKELSKIVRTLKKFITEMNKFHANAMFQHVYEAGGDTYETLKGIGDAGKNVGGISNYLLWQNMRPAYAFERFGEGGKAIYDEFRRAQSILAFNSKKIIEFSEKTYSDAEVKAWENEYKVFKLGDDEVHIPISFIMSFYELAKQPDSVRHILGEGIRVATYKDGKEKISDNGHTLTQKDVSTIIDSLTERQKEVADNLQKYMSTQGAEWGNYVSLKRFGEELFTNPQYFPINSDGRHLESTAEEHPSNASLYALLNMSFTKQRNEEANNRIVLYSIFDVFANHMASMAQYNAFALPILDSLKWFNYKETMLDENGKTVILGSIREEMSRVYGVPEENRPGSGRAGYAETFIKNIIRAYNGTETQGVATDEQGIKWLHKYNMAQIAYNLRVCVLQPLAITRAGLIIDYRSILKAMNPKPSLIKANIEEMHKYSGIAVWKDLGFYDINISRGLTDLIKHNKSALEKISDFGMIGAEKADTITWAAMWNACKVEVSKKQKNIKVGSKEYFESVSKLFEDVIYKTQVVDSVLTKTEFMRSKGFASRALSSFMSEPVATASMLIDTYTKFNMDMQKGMSRQQAWQKNKNLIVRTTAVYCISELLIAAVQSVVDAGRDDDDDKNWFEKYGNAFIGNVIDELMPFNKMPILSDFYDLAKTLASIFGVDTYGNPPQSIIMQWYDSLVKGTQILHDKIISEKTPYTLYAGVYKMLQALSGITGLPLATATREIINGWNNTAGSLNYNLKVKSYNPSAEVKKYIGYIESENTVKANEFYSDWVDDKKEDIINNRKNEGKTDLTDVEAEQKAKSSIKTSISAKYREKYVQAYRNNDTETMTKIRKEMYSTGIYGNVDDVIEICKKWLKDYM